MSVRNWAQFRKLLRSPEFGHNRDVYQFFKDADREGNELRRSLRDMCLVQATDSINDAKMRIKIFRDLVQRAHLKPDVYGVPIENFQEIVEFRPQVYMYFAQDAAAVPEGKHTIEARIQFRLMDETPATVTENNARSLATNIANEFVIAGRGYTFTKGKNIVVYRDPVNGYSLQIYSNSKAEGEEVVKKILSIRNHIFDSNKLSVSTPERNSTNNPSGTTLVYERQKPNRRWRPTANVRFRFATLQLCGLMRDVMLVDTTGRYHDALVKR